MKWLENFKLSQRLYFALTCFLVLMVVMTYVSLTRLATVNQNLLKIQTNWMPAAAAVAEMKNAFNNYRVPVLQYILESDGGDSRELAYLEEQLPVRLDIYRRHEANFVSLIVDERERQLLGQARQLMHDYLQLNQAMLDLYRQHLKAEALALMRGPMRNKKDELLKTLDAMGQFEFEGGSQTARDSSELLDSSRREAFVLLALMGFFELMGFYVVRVFSTSMNVLQRAGVNTFSSTSQLAAVVKAQEATIGEQAASSSEIVASAKEISATSKALSSNMDEIVHVASETSAKAEAGRQGLAQLDEAMQRMVEATHGIAAKLAVLNANAGNINAVVKLITRIADQTNLLSLNAAIESEQAGEHGLGFSVVATEIRRLSDQTAVATFDIEKILKDMQSSVSASVLGMDQFAEDIRRNVDEVRNISHQLSDITQQIKALSPRFEVILEGMQAQDLGTEQISESLTQFNESIHQTAESIRNYRQTAILLEQASQDLKQIVKALG